LFVIASDAGYGFVVKGAHTSHGLASSDTCRKFVEINGTKSYGVKHLNSENSGIGTYRNASKPCFRGFDSLRPLQIPMQRPLTPTSARGFLFSGFTA
ncbi:hypothetical protein, partial [Pseudomonas aeruginosa]|uniref:hypothetical protein n=1 Tax=Pseudomonas aeruginosa TaxID=287 RepID=UPI003969B406